jgi:DnaJ-domain-containing protein 1
MDELNKQYATLMAQYEDEVQQAIQSGDIKPHIQKLKQLNQQLSSVLDEMLHVSVQSKTRTDMLFEQLDRIQKDYNGLVQSTDQLETLRRIRDQRNPHSFQTFFYLFIGLCLLLFVFVFFKNYISDSTASIPTTPAITPPLI